MSVSYRRNNQQRRRRDCQERGEHFQPERGSERAIHDGRTTYAICAHCGEPYVVGAKIAPPDKELTQ